MICKTAVKETHKVHILPERADRNPVSAAASDVAGKDVRRVLHTGQWRSLVLGQVHSESELTPFIARQSSPLVIYAREGRRQHNFYD